MTTYRPEDVNETMHVPFEHDGDVYVGELARIKNVGWKRRKLYKDDSADPRDERAGRFDRSSPALWTDELPSTIDLLHEAGVAESSQRRRT